MYSGYVIYNNVQPFSYTVIGQGGVPRSQSRAVMDRVLGSARSRTMALTPRILQTLAQLFMGALPSWSKIAERGKQAVTTNSANNQRQLP
jgi:hypothetical protein